MENLKSKEELVQLLRSGAVEEFNKARSYGNSTLLDLTEIELKDVKLEGANLSKTDLTGSDFFESEITGVDFSESDLSSVNLSHSTIIESNFTDAIFEGSFLNNAQIKCSDFSGSNMTGANISCTDLTGSDLSNCGTLIQTVYDDETTWPDDDLLPEDFSPEFEKSLAELEDDGNEFVEDNYSY